MNENLKLRFDNTVYDVSVPFGTMLKCVCSNGVFAWANNENGEVLSIKDGAVSVLSILFPSPTGFIPFDAAYSASASAGVRRPERLPFSSRSNR